MVEPGKWRDIQVINNFYKKEHTNYIMKKREIEIWDVIIWICIIILILYVIAKLTGLINTPEWINLIPIITLIFFAGAFYQKIIGFIDRIYNRTDYLKININKLIDKNIETDKRLFAIEKQQETFSKLLAMKK